MYNKKLGFSLIELLVAISILSMAIALANVVYANYVNTDAKFARQALFYSNLSEATDFVRARFKQGEETGAVDVSGLHCRWSLIERTASKRKVHNVETGAVAESGETYYLNTIEIACSADEREIDTIKIKVLTYNLLFDDTGIDL